MSGYSIIQADNIEEARELAKIHPFLSEGKGNFAVELYELMNVPY